MAEGHLRAHHLSYPLTHHQLAVIPVSPQAKTGTQVPASIGLSPGSQFAKLGPGHLLRKFRDDDKLL